MSRHLIQVNPGRYRQVTVEEMAAQLQPVSLPCVHLGTQTGERVGCGTCSGRTELKIFACARHSRCTIARQVKDLACCATCPDQQERDFTRHLIYHIYPRKGSNWRWNVEQLLQRIDLFDGRRIVAIVTDATTDHPVAVREALAAGQCEFIEMANNQALWEVATHEALFGRIADLTGPEHVTLRAHAKGVSNHTWPDGGATIRLWTETLYETLLDYWPLVAGVLKAHPLAGSLFRPGKYFPNSPSTWHYAGSWYWFRNKDVLAKPWKEIEQRPHGVETFPSLHFSAAETGVVFGELAMGQASWPYQSEYWRKTLLPQLHFWRADNVRHLERAKAIPGISLSIIVPTSGRPSLNRTLASITSQMLPQDQLLVLRDDSGDWGNTPRNHGITMATGDYLMFMDDDDTYHEGALAMVRRALAENPGRPHIFRMARHGRMHDCLPDKKIVAAGQISTQMFVFPNNPERLGRWSQRYEGDFDFADSTLALYPPDSLIWRDEIIAIWRPDELRVALEPSDQNQTTGLREMHRDIARVASLKTMVEVGSSYGASTRVHALFAEIVTAVDPWPDENTFLAFCFKKPTNVVVCRKRSLDAALDFADGSLDLVYIDAEHDYDSVVSDISAWLPKIRKGGWIAGHDYHPDFGVMKAVNDILGNPDKVYPDTSWLFRN